MVVGLTNTNYDNIASIIQQSDLLPTFETARSRLLHEKSRRAKDRRPNLSQHLRHRRHNLRHKDSLSHRRAVVATAVGVFVAGIKTPGS